MSVLARAYLKYLLNLVLTQIWSIKGQKKLTEFQIQLQSIILG